MMAGPRSLYRAAVMNHMETVKALLEAGADPNVQPDGGWTSHDRVRLNQIPRSLYLLLEAESGKP